MGGADIDIRLGRHSSVTDGMRSLEANQPVLVGYSVGVAEIFDQFECMAYR